MGTRFIDRREYEHSQWNTTWERFVYWNDGTIWSGELGDNRDVPMALSEVQRIRNAGRYYVIVCLENGKDQEGWVEFKPSHFYPTLRDYLSAAYSHLGLETLEVLEATI